MKQNEKRNNVYKFKSLNEMFLMIESNEIKNLFLRNRKTHLYPYFEMLKMSIDMGSFLSFSYNENYIFENNSIIPKNQSIRISFNEEKLDILKTTNKDIRDAIEKYIDSNYNHELYESYTIKRDKYEKKVLFLYCETELNNIRRKINQIEIYDIDEILEQFENNGGSLISQNSLKNGYHETDEGYITNVKINQFTINSVLETNKKLKNEKNIENQKEIIENFLQDYCKYSGLRYEKD